MTETQTNWGRWGAEDERGALNLLTDEVVLQATRACRTGRSYQLGLTITREGLPTIAHRGNPQRFTLLNHTDRGHFATIGAPDNVGFTEDVVSFATHTGTHMDALCHVDHDGSFYNGHPKEGMTALNGAEKCGIEKAGPIAARGVLVDVAGWRGVDVLPPEAISLADFQATLQAQGSEIRAGDVVLVRTGWLEQYMAEGGPLPFDQAGIGLEVARWLAEQDVVAVGADNCSVEVTPWDGGEFLGGHVELLVRRGIYLVENLWLQDLGRDGCHEFLFVAAPLPVAGATGSPVNPLAIG